jgi:uncharacterized protein (TIGR03067 family)
MRYAPFLAPIGLLVTVGAVHGAKPKGWSVRPAALVRSDPSRASDLTALRQAPKTLEGSWIVIAGDATNRDWRPFKEITMTFTGGQLTVKRDGKIERLLYRLDPQLPANIDLLSGDAKDKPLLGIFTLDGDTLKLCWSKIDGKDRPTEFEIKAGKSRHVLLHLKRHKE